MHDLPSPRSADPDTAGELPSALVDDIAGRLRQVCEHLSADDFTALVTEIARTKIRFAQRAASLPGLSGVWDPPASEVLRLLASPDSAPGLTKTNDA